MIEQSDMTQFYKILCSNSVSKDPKLAVLEWNYSSSYMEKNNCICGNPIQENCVIENTKNGNTLIVGNVCINKFMDMDYSFIFLGMKKVNKMELPSKSFINYCYDKKILSEYEKNLLLNMRGKKIRNKEGAKYKELTEKQKQFFEKIIFKLQNTKNY